MFLNACEISGLAEIIDMIRIISSVVLIGTQYNPKKPKEIYLRQLKRLAEDGLGRTGFNQLIKSSSVSASGGFVDFTFLGLQKNKDLNDQLMELLLGVLNILNEGGEYINICSDLGLSEELQELKSEIMGLKQSK
ncbi:hypothetical protein [Endozoicomonas sp. ALB032]|uniref:hypothetical protein n=1 Tax=Endozoicomonas sp. ALB032 TaxID=3403082 RepID=UPI003BB62029